MRNREAVDVVDLRGRQRLAWCDDLVSGGKNGDARSSDDLNIGVTECSSCKIQMEQGTTIPTLHPLKLMAYSYGLMPSIANKLHRTTGKLIVS